MSPHSRCRSPLKQPVLLHSVAHPMQCAWQASAGIGRVTPRDLDAPIPRFMHLDTHPSYLWLQVRAAVAPGKSPAVTNAITKASTSCRERISTLRQSTKIQFITRGRGLSQAGVTTPTSLDPRCVRGDSAGHVSRPSAYPPTAAVSLRRSELALPANSGSRSCLRTNLVGAQKIALCNLSKMPLLGRLP
jgi:hypothetical protein